MRQKRRGIKGLFFLMLMIALVASYVGADETKILNVNTSVSDKAEERESNVYQFELASNGKLNIQLKHTNLFSTKVYWTVEVLADDLKTVLQTFNSTGTDTNLIGPSLGLTKGTYYVKVYARKECSHEYSDTPYTLSARFSPSTSWEIEYNAAKKQGNDSQGTATKMTVGKYSYGTVASSSDIDFFKVSIPKNGTVSLTFVHPNIYEAADYWNVQLVNAKTEKVYELSSKGTKKTTTTPKIGVTAGTYYVRVTGGGSGRYSDRDYRVRVNYSKTSTWEKEYTSKTARFNNAMTTANVISRGKWISGTISSESDVDFMRFTVPSAKTVTIKFSHTYKPKTTKWWKITLYNSRTSEIYSFYSRGIDETLTKKIRLSKGTYFVKVSMGTKWSTSAYKLYVK